MKYSKPGKSLWPLLVTSNWEIKRSLWITWNGRFPSLDLQVVNEAAKRCQRFVSGWHETYQGFIDGLAPQNSCKVGMTILFYYAQQFFRVFFGGFQEGNLWHFPDQISSMWMIRGRDWSHPSSWWVFQMVLSQTFLSDFSARTLREMNPTWIIMF